MADRPPLDSFAQKPPLESFFTSQEKSAPEKLDWSEVPGKAAESFLPDVGNVLSGIAQVGLHPIEAAKEVGRVGAGAASYAGVPGVEQYRPHAKALMDHYIEAYGGAENLKQTIANHPAEFLTDFFSLLSGGEAAMAKAGIDISRIGKVGEVAQTAARGPEVTRTPVEAAIPTSEDLLGGYKRIKSEPGPWGGGAQGGIMKIELHPHVLPELKQNIADALHDKDVFPHLASKVYQTLEHLQSEPGRVPTIATIERVRGALRHAPFDERFAAAVARDRIDDMLSSIDIYDVKEGQKVANVLRDVRGDYRAGSNIERLEQAKERGFAKAERAGSGANLDNALRQEIDKVISSPKTAKFLTKDEIEMLKKARRGGRVDNAARLLSKFGPKHPVTGWGFAGLADLQGGMGAATGLMGIGHIAQKISERARLRSIEKAQRELAKGSPTYKKRLAEMGPSEQPASFHPLRYLYASGGINDLVQNLGGQNVPQ